MKDRREEFENIVRNGTRARVFTLDVSLGKSHKVTCGGGGGGHLFLRMWLVVFCHGHCKLHIDK